MSCEIGGILAKGAAFGKSFRISSERGKLLPMDERIHLQAGDDGVAVLTFHRPEAHNALNQEMMQQFADAIQQLRQNPAVRVVILTGAGEQAFCAGGDLAELSHYPAAEAGAAMSRRMGDALLALEQLPFPVIAAVNGYALGGGSEIALACDMRIVDAHVRMGLVHIRLGLIPGWGAGQRLLRLVGYACAMEILLCGQPMQAQELQAYGLVNRVVEAGNALPHALDFARSIAAQSPAVVGAIKQLLLAGINQPYLEALRVEQELFPDLWAAPAHLEAVAEFLRSRKG